MKVFMFLICFSLLACEKGQNFNRPNVVESKQTVTDAALEPPDNSRLTAKQQESLEGAEQNIGSSQTHIIRTSDYRFQVLDVNKSSSLIEQKIERFGGYVSNMNLTNTNTEITNKITLRVPSGNFNKMLESLSSEAVFVDYKKVSAEDVSEEYLDINIRLKTKKEVRDRYIAILKNNAKTVKDILAAEEQIRVIQEEIESIEGRLRYLQNQIGYSTINLELYQKVEYKETPKSLETPFGLEIKNAFKSGWKIVTGLFLFLIYVWPIVLILLFILIVKRKSFINWRKK